MTEIELIKIKKAAFKAFKNFSDEKIEDAVYSSIELILNGKIEKKHLFVKIKQFLIADKKRFLNVDDLYLHDENNQYDMLIEADDFKKKRELLFKNIQFLGPKQKEAIKKHLNGENVLGCANYKQALKKLRNLMGGKVHGDVCVTLKNLRKRKGDRTGNQYNLAFVNDIRTSNLPVKELAEKYATSTRSIRRILEYKVYRDV